MFLVRAHRVARVRVRVCVCLDHDFMPLSLFLVLAHLLFCKAGH